MAGVRKEQSNLKDTDCSSESTLQALSWPLWADP